MPRRSYYVYIAASLSRTTYVGVTNDLARRMHEHRTKAAEGFSARYNVNRLVWFETTENIRAAIEREKQIKSYSRKKKLALIEAQNAAWNDLAVEMGLVAEEDRAPDAAEQPGSRVAAAPGPRGGGE